MKQLCSLGIFIFMQFGYSAKCYRFVLIVPRSGVVQCQQEVSKRFTLDAVSVRLPLSPCGGEKK